MKNKLNLVTVSMLLIVLSSCTKNVHKDEFSDIEIKTDLLSKDTSFKNLIELENNLSDEIKKVMITRNLNKEDLLVLIEQINNSKTDLGFKNILTENNIPELYSTLQKFNLSFKKNWGDLGVKFNRLSSNEVIIASNKYFENYQFKKIYSINKKAFSINNNNIARACGWGYSLCIAGATAGAILCHGSCIGGTAGFGAPACVLLCGTIQVSVGAACMSSYCEEN